MDMTDIFEQPLGADGEEATSAGGALRRSRSPRAAPRGRRASDARETGAAPVAAAGLSVVQGDREFFNRVIKLLLKSSLSNSFQLRVLRSIVIQVMLVPVAAGIVGHIKTATEKYAEAAKAFRNPELRQNRVGVPHYRAWNGVLLWAKEKITTGEPAARLRAYIEKVSPLGPHAFQKDVRHVRVAKAWDVEKKKIEVSVIEGSDAAIIWQDVKTFLVRHCKARELQGMAPTGHFEDETQQILDQLTTSG